MEKQREKAAQRLQRKQQRQSPPAEDSLEVLDGPPTPNPELDGESTPFAG
jgi:hypothetical protein